MISQVGLEKLGIISLHLVFQAILAVTMLHGVRTYPFPQGGGITIPKPGADGGFEGDQFFQYINVPAADQFEWGYRRGNTEHNREQSLSQKAGGFKAKVRHNGRRTLCL